ncbi:ArpU family phage packaging/lysis transcriptional regulator [Streptococcus pasteurianus]|mgnify:FL=1|uniref:ArpU family phage packaging/lysis transcriptional regulator n=1 Tax=Streptococcus pasteurianus TaxID=197614 RepID=UPI002283D310|nr:ArpU family phage packaging/lysis transcriptional regulator [Streptococcus pasteurianus]MCY7244790.1 transcriptional regulator [Streptococcus pasteurianus]
MEIDKKLTKRNAYEVLKLYRRYSRMAGEELIPKITDNYLFELKTVELSHIKVERQLQAFKELQAITEAINSIDKQYLRQILIEKYCKWHNKKDYIIYDELMMSETNFYLKLERGVIEFARYYKNGELLVFSLEQLTRHNQF